MIHINHRIEFSLGQIVFLATDPEQHPRMITGISLRPNRSVIYAVTLGNEETNHYGIEVRAEKGVIAMMGGEG